VAGLPYVVPWLFVAGRPALLDAAPLDAAPLDAAPFDATPECDTALEAEPGVEFAAAEPAEPAEPGVIEPGLAAAGFGGDAFVGVDDELLG
jgi:hypothetical protein